MAGRVLEELELGELRELVGHPELGWSLLREQPEQWAALELFSFRLQALLTAGALDQALDEIDRPAVRHDLLRVDALEQVLMSVLLAAAWNGGPRVDELALGVARQDRADDALAARFRQARALAPTWQRLHGEEPWPEALRRFVELFPSVGYTYRRSLVDDLRAALANQRAAIARGLDRMVGADERLLRYVFELTDGLIHGEELAYDDLPERERAYIATAMEKVSFRLAPRGGRRRWRRTIWGAAVGVLATVAIGGYAGLLVGTGVLLVVFLNEALAGLGQVMHATRERMADAVIETGLPPDRMLEWANRRAQAGPEPNNPLGFDAGLADDLALHTLGRLSRVCLLWARRHPE